jgi:hypothetical protein
MKPRKLFIALLFLANLLLACLSQAQAQQPSVGITPASVDAQITPGASYTQVFSLINQTAVRLRFHCWVGDVWYDQQNQQVTGNAGKLPRSGSLWLQFSPIDVVLEPHSVGTTRAVVTVPPGVAGSYYLMPIFEGAPDTSQAVDAAAPARGITASAAIGIRFRAIMMLTTEFGAEYNVEIMGGQITPPTATSEFTLLLDVRNRGTAHANLHGAFAILNEAGALVGRGKLADKRVLPGQRKNLEGGWAGDPPPAGTYTCVITLSHDRVGADPTAIVYELPFEIK